MTERRPDGTTVFERVFEDKGHKITMKFSILDEPKLQLQPKTQPDLLHEEIKHAAKEAEKMKRIRDHLGASIT